MVRSFTRRFTTRPGAETPEELSVEIIERLIREAGRIPVERDTLYHRVERNGSQWNPGQRIVPVNVLAGSK